jgi:hypothetical protein
MRRRQAPDVGEGRRRKIHVAAEEEEVGDRRIVQPVGDGRVAAEDSESVADEERVPPAGVVEGTNAEVVAGAEEELAAAVPDGEGEVAEEVVDALLAPETVGAEEEVSIGGGGEIGGGLPSPAEFLLEFGAAVEAGVGDDGETAVKGEGLTSTGAPSRLTMPMKPLTDLSSWTVRT